MRAGFELADGALGIPTEVRLRLFPCSLELCPISQNRPMWLSRDCARWAVRPLAVGPRTSRCHLVIWRRDQDWRF